MVEDGNRYADARWTLEPAARPRWAPGQEQALEAQTPEERVRLAVQSLDGRRPERLVPLMEGLGTRRFYRVFRNQAEPATLIARVEAPEDPAGRPEGAAPEPDLEPVRAAFEARGLPVPRRLGGDVGVELLEDLGDTPLTRVLATADSDQRRRLYEEALALIPRLQRVDDRSLEAFQRALDGRLIGYKADLFAQWSLPVALGQEPKDSERQLVRDAFFWIAEALADAPLRLAHRDFQSLNLHLHARPNQAPRIFMIDLQGAFLAPPEYDAVCLLHDSYADLSEDEIEDLAAWLRPQLPKPPSAEEFACRFDLLTLVRKGKDHARYLQARQAGTGPAYLAAAIGRAARSLRRAAEHAAQRHSTLAELAELLAKLPEGPCER